MEAAWRTCAAFCTPLTQGAYPPRDCDRNISVVLRESECDDPTRCKGSFLQTLCRRRQGGRSGRRLAWRAERAASTHCVIWSTLRGLNVVYGLADVVLAVWYIKDFAT